MHIVATSSLMKEKNLEDWGGTFQILFLKLNVSEKSWNVKFSSPNFSANIFWENKKLTKMNFQYY